MKQGVSYGARRFRAYTIAAVFLCLAGVAGLGASSAPDAPSSATRLVELTRCIPDIVLDIRYATPNNFTGKAVYPDSRCFLAGEAASALCKVQADLKKKGYRLKVFDGYRPLSIQRLFWEILPDPRFVADPREGSKHNRGYAVDVSLVTLEGTDVSMPTEYDDFTERARSDYRKLPKEVIQHRAALRRAMEKRGFKRFDTEWWHFDYRGWEDQPLLDVPLDKIPGSSPGPNATEPGK